MNKDFKFKLYFRKSSFKKDILSANILFEQIESHKPKHFLEVGVFQGVTSRNICEKLNLIHQNQFKYYGIDIFEDGDDLLDNKEMTSKHNKISNPIKHLLYNIIFKENLNSLKSVKELLKKFNNNVTLYKGLSEKVLPKINISEIDFIFLDGGHSYETVKNDLFLLLKDIKKNKVIICDDYDQKNYGVKKAVDELINNVTEIKELNKRLVKIIT
jgi:hypothetical protein